MSVPGFRVFVIVADPVRDKPYPDPTIGGKNRARIRLPPRRKPDPDQTLQIKSRINYILSIINTQNSEKLARRVKLPTEKIPGGFLPKHKSSVGRKSRKLQD